LLNRQPSLQMLRQGIGKRHYDGASGGLCHHRTLDEQGSVGRPSGDSPSFRRHGKREQEEERAWSSHTSYGREEKQENPP
jgi:hypothetical protein